MEFVTGLGHLPTVCDFGQFTVFPEFEFLFFNMEIITITSHSYLEKNTLPGT